MTAVFHNPKGYRTTNLSICSRQTQLYCCQIWSGSAKNWLRSTQLF